MLYCSSRFACTAAILVTSCAIDWQVCVHGSNLLVLSWFTTMCNLYCKIYHLNHRPKCRKRKRNVGRSRRTFLKVNRSLADRNFLRHVRTTRHGFALLLGLLKGDFEENEAMARLSSGGTIAVDIRLKKGKIVSPSSAYCAYNFQLQHI